MRFYPAQEFSFRFVFSKVETTSFPPFFPSMKYVSLGAVATRFIRASAGASRLEITLQKITGGFLAHLNAGVSDGVQPPSVR